MGNALTVMCGPTASAGIARCSVLGVDSDGFVSVGSPTGGVLVCEVLQGAVVGLGAGDSVLVLLPDGMQPGVVFGRIGPYVLPPTARHLELASSESLSIRCGDSSLELRSDGKVLIKGEDVTVRAKGTQRIRAGTVSIN